MSEDPECTDCEGSGVMHQTERYCTCSAGIALNPQPPHGMSDEIETQAGRMIEYCKGSGNPAISYDAVYVMTRLVADRAALTAERDALRADDCDPDGCAAHISAFASRVDALTAQLAQRDAVLRAADELILALNWYADQSAIMAKPTIDAQWASNRLRADRGETGRRAIAAYRKARGQDA